MSENIYESFISGSACGIDMQAGTLDINALIGNVMSNGGRLKIYNEDADAFDCFMHEMLSVAPGEYDDGYSKEIDQNIIKKLNGISFENYILRYSKGKLKRNSSAVFSLARNYEQGADFTVCSYTLADGSVIGEKPLEAKNCLDMESFLKTRTHNALYVIVNSRFEHKIRLLCRLTQSDRRHLQDFVCYGDYKEIAPWYWMRDMISDAMYEQHRLDRSWCIHRGADGNGRYVEFISPLCD